MDRAVSKFYDYKISMIRKPHIEEFYAFCMMHEIGISINGPVYKNDEGNSNSYHASYMVKDATINLKIPSDEVNDLFLLKFSNIVTILSLNTYPSKFHYEHLTRI